MANQPEKYLVIQTYRSPYPDPIKFKKEEQVVIEVEYCDDPEWKDWFWCTGQYGQQAWVPRQYLLFNGKVGNLRQDYNALELSIREGEEILVHKVINGFALAEKADGSRGWVPLRNLQALMRR